MSSIKKSDQGTGIGVRFVGLSFILDLKQRGIAPKVAKLWQVITFFK